MDLICLAVKGVNGLLTHVFGFVLQWNMMDSRPFTLRCEAARKTTSRRQHSLCEQQFGKTSRGFLRGLYYTFDESVSLALIRGCSPPAASVSVAVLPAVLARPCSESDPSGLSLRTAACCLLRSSASDVQPNGRCIYRNVSNIKHATKSGSLPNLF